VQQSSALKSKKQKAKSKKQKAKSKKQKATRKAMLFWWHLDISYDHRTLITVRSLVEVNICCFHICFHTPVERL